MRKGFVVSDLHLFTKRSHAASLQPHLDEAMVWADFVVLNGDIFDFKWSVLPSVEETVEAALEWLERLAGMDPTAELHYLLGNHDALEAFVDRLPELARRIPNFHWHPTHLRLGSAFFTHGDLRGTATVAGGPIRKLERKVVLKRELMHDSYNYLVALKVHHVVRVTHGRRQSVRKMLRLLATLDPVLLEGVTDVYFGHTHVPFSDHEEGGYRFHNTGSAIRGLPFNPQTVLLSENSGD
jgi:UDP-2,3-diacylglucosamine pyrophosphatase LpxH